MNHSPGAQGCRMYGIIADAHPLINENIPEIISAAGSVPLATRRDYSDMLI